MNFIPAHNPFLILVLSLPFLIGCSKFQKVDELLVLKRVSDEQTRMTKDVQATDERFGKLLSDVQAGRLGQDHTKRSISRRYGEPILTEKRFIDQQELEVWLYRYAKQFLRSEKVYFYFDSAGKLKKWEYLQPQEVHDGENGKETTVEASSP
jgi:hypothetical protein